MKKICCVLIAVIFLTGCALTTIKSPKKHVERPEPPKQTVAEKVKSVFTPKSEPKAVTAEKEEILPLRIEEKEEIK